MNARTSTSRKYQTAVGALRGALGWLIRGSGNGSAEEPVKVRVREGQNLERLEEPLVLPEPVTYHVTRARRVRARPIDRAVCDLMADPNSEITRVTVVGSQPEYVEALEALALERGLDAVAATSPSLRRGWIRITRSASPEAGLERLPVRTSEPPRAER